MNTKKLLKAGLSALIVILAVVGCYIFGFAPDNDGGGVQDQESSGYTLFEDGLYTSKEDVSLYLHEYGKLPQNYITKAEARDLGWDSGKNTLDQVAPGKSIGGGRYGNYEKLLPENDYKECDIDYSGGPRNAKRIVYSDDGDIYYTEDHYASFEQLY